MRFPKNMMWSPEQYAEAAVLAHEAANEMLSRLEWMTIKPAVILDAGCGLGELSNKLQLRFPDAQVLALDASLPMLQAVAQASVTRICAEAETLPLRDQSIDLICANLLLPWCDDVSLMLREWRRVLRPNGLVMLTALGPDREKAL